MGMVSKGARACLEVAAAYDHLLMAGLSYIKPCSDFLVDTIPGCEDVGATPTVWDW